MATTAAATAHHTTIKKDLPKIAVKGFEDRLTPKAHTVYKIFFGEKMICVKRYSEFDALHKKLQARFRIFTLQRCRRKS